METVANGNDPTLMAEWETIYGDIYVFDDGILTGDVDVMMAGEMFCTCDEVLGELCVDTPGLLLALFLPLLELWLALRSCTNESFNGFM